ncbi:MAG: acyl-CoA thioesterase [Actinomycetota bacterium]|nr:acyl-CoA thioesterase [Actinomycetota bacterium]
MKQHLLDSVPGVRWIPQRTTGVGALVLAGSSGRVDSARAKLLATHGALAESIQWFGAEGQHNGPWEIPIELFLERVRDLRQHCDRVVVLGTSFGSEAALLTGVNSDDVAAVVAFAPSDVVWSGITADGRSTSHWTLHGEPLPYVPFIDDWEPETDPPAFVNFYLQCRKKFADQVAEATIPVERIPNVIVVAGGDDQVWPAVTHAQAIASRRHEHGLETTVITDPMAGHRTILPGEPVVVGGLRMARGGTETADRRLGSQAWPHIERLL